MWVDWEIQRVILGSGIPLLESSMMSVMYSLMPIYTRLSWINNYSLPLHCYRCAPFLAWYQSHSIFLELPPTFAMCQHGIHSLPNFIFFVSWTSLTMLSLSPCCSFSWALPAWESSHLGNLVDALSSRRRLFSTWHCPHKTAQFWAEFSSCCVARSTWAFGWGLAMLWGTTPWSLSSWYQGSSPALHFCSRRFQAELWNLQFLLGSSLLATSLAVHSCLWTPRIWWFQLSHFTIAEI